MKKKLNQTGPRIRSGDLVLVGTGDQTDPGLAVPVTHLDAEMTPSRSRKRRRIALACSLPPTAVRFNSPSCLGEKIEGTSRTGILNSLPDDIQPYIPTIKTCGFNKLFSQQQKQQQPTNRPTNQPTYLPTHQPTNPPSHQANKRPSDQQTTKQTNNPNKQTKTHTNKQKHIQTNKNT